MPQPSPALIIVGLGPGDVTLLTLEAREVLTGAAAVWLRTARHPAVAGLPQGPRYHSFDQLYEEGTDFDAVYAAIVEAVLEAAAAPGGCVYAVPGHPLFGEATVAELLNRAAAASIVTRIVPGLSYLDVVAPVVGLDPLADGCLLLDALALDPQGRGLAPNRPAVIAQVYDRRSASAVKLALLSAYPPDHLVTIVRDASGAGATTEERALSDLDHDDAFDHLTSLYVPAVAPFADVRTFEGLRRVVARLRDPDGGCPWDLEQTHDSLKRYLLEEAYETLEALEAGEPSRLAEELGDLLMQVLLHAQLAEDANEFVIEDVLSSISTKLIRRHPHVFGEVQVSGAQEVLKNWETLKKEERGDTPVLDAVPRAMAALMQAQSAQSRAAKHGLIPPAARVPTPEAISAIGPAPDAEAIGDLLFAIVAICRAHDIDAEEALRKRVERFRDEVSAIERAQPARD